MNNKFITIKDEEGNYRPMVGIWRDDETLKFHQPDIDKFMKKGKEEGLKLVKIEIKEVI